MQCACGHVVCRCGGSCMLLPHRVVKCKVWKSPRILPSYSLVVFSVCVICSTNFFYLYCRETVICTCCTIIMLCCIKDWCCCWVLLACSSIFEGFFTAMVCTLHLCPNVLHQTKSPQWQMKIGNLKGMSTSKIYLSTYLSSNLNNWAVWCFSHN